MLSLYLSIRKGVVKMRRNRRLSRENKEGIYEILINQTKNVEPINYFSNLTGNMP